MPINWGPIDNAIDRAAETTNADLARRLAAITRLTDEEVADLFPAKADAERLKRLLEIVKSAEARNTKINRIVDNIEDLAGTVVTLLENVA